jgi:xanthine dehydrogenase YagS FAD-binding subunit
MIPFTYSRATDSAAAIREAAQAGAKYLGGGTNLVDLMREGVERPSALVDVTGLDRGITELENGGLRIGAATSNPALAADRRVRDTPRPALESRDGPWPTLVLGERLKPRLDMPSDFGP